MKKPKKKNNQNNFEQLQIDIPREKIPLIKPEEKEQPGIIIIELF